jgi:hypothetical protein
MNTNLTHIELIQLMILEILTERYDELSEDQKIGLIEMYMETISQ